MEAETRMTAGDLVIQEDCDNIDWAAVRDCACAPWAWPLVIRNCIAGPSSTASP